MTLYLSAASLGAHGRSALCSVPAPDRAGGLRGGTLRPERHQELPDPRPGAGLRVPDPHHQGAGEAAHDRW